MHRAALVAFMILVGNACASSPAVTADQLNLRRVVIYRNGVAYFEREGHVTEDRVRFKVREDEVGDFLASFAVMEKGGSAVRAASFPLRREGAEIPVDNSPAGKEAAADQRRGLATVVMDLDGRQHDLMVGYIAEAPVWRPSYRLVLHQGQAHLQLWGIVQNLSGEDWNRAHLTLVADAPLALTAQLEKPIVPERPVLSEGGGVIAVVPQSETTLAAAPPPPPAAAPAPSVASQFRGALGKKSAKAEMALDEEEAESAKDEDKVALSQLETGPGGGAAPLARIRRMAGPSRTRNLAAMAAVAVAGGTTRYVLPDPVTVPDHSAAMLLLADKEVPGESASLYAPDPGVPESAAHPFRVARFTNKTGGLLERGPLAFFGEGGFLGQGVIDSLPEGASATVPFGLQRELAVERTVEYIQEGARLFQVEGGALYIERQVGPRTRYKISSGTDREHALWLKHQRQYGAKLINPPQGTEDNVGTGSALIPAQVRARSTTELVVDERMGRQQTESWLSPLAEDAVKDYLSSPEGKRAEALQAAWATRGDWKDLTEHRMRLQTEQNDLRTATEETRQNLLAIAKNKNAEDLRTTLTARLSKDSARMDEVTKRLIQTDMQVKEMELRFREAVKLVKIPPRSS